MVKREIAEGSRGLELVRFGVAIKAGRSVEESGQTCPGEGRDVVSGVPEIVWKH